MSFVKGHRKQQTNRKQHFFSTVPKIKFFFFSMTSPQKELHFVFEKRQLLRFWRAATVFHFSLFVRAPFREKSLFLFVEVHDGHDAGGLMFSGRLSRAMGEENRRLKLLSFQLGLKIQFSPVNALR